MSVERATDNATGEGANSGRHCRCPYTLTESCDCLPFVNAGDLRPGDRIVADSAEHVVEFVHKAPGRSGVGWSWRLKVEGRDPVTVNYSTNFRTVRGAA